MTRTTTITLAATTAPRRALAMAGVAAGLATALLMTGCGTATTDVAARTSITTPTAAPTAAPSATPAAATAAKVLAPKPGTFKMTRTGTGAGAVQQGVQNVAPAADGSAQQIIDYKTPDSVTRSLLNYTAQGVMMTEQDTNLGHGIVLKCVMPTPVELFPAELKVGATWAFDTTCPVTVGPVAGTLKMSEHFDVSGITKVTIGTHTGAAFVVHQTATVVLTTSAGVSTTTVDQTQDFIAGLGLTVRSTLTSHNDYKGKGTDTGTVTTLDGTTIG